MLVILQESKCRLIRKMRKRNDDYNLSGPTATATGGEGVCMA